MLDVNFTNGFVDEILECSRKKLWTKDDLNQVIYAVAPHKDMLNMKPETLRSKLTRLKRKKGNHKKGTPKYNELLSSLFWSRDVGIDDPVPSVYNEPEVSHPPTVPVYNEHELAHSTPLTAKPPIPQVQPSVEILVPCTPSTCTVNKNINELDYKIQKREKHLAVLDRKINVKMGTLSTSGHYTKKNVNKRDATGLLIRRDCRTFKNQMSDSSKEIEHLNALVQTLKKDNVCLKAKCLHEKIKKRIAQKTCSRAKVSLKDHVNCVARKKFATVDQLCRQQARIIQDLQTELDQLKDTLTNKLCVQDEQGYTIEMRMLVNELTSLEVAQSKVGPVINAVTNHLFNTDVSPLPNRTTVQHINDEGHFLAKCYIGETLKESSGFGIGTDGTSRRREKILDTTLTSSSGDAMSCGFTKVASETGQTIADVTIGQLKELAFVTGQSESDFLVSLLQKLSFYMSDRASNEKKSHKILDQWRADVLKNIPEEQKPEVHKFHCMAHVLLGFHTNVLSELSPEQKHLEETMDLGRDKLEQFGSFRPDQVAQRVIKATSDVFGPVGEFLGLRDLWEAHCAQHGIKSRISNYKDNRFNGLFQTAAQVLHHVQDFIYVLHFRTSNKKLQSVQGDLEDPIVITFVQALAIVYVQITGPYWHLMVSGDVPYVSLYNIIQPLLEYIEECNIDPQPLYNPEGPACLAPYRGPDSHAYVDMVVSPKYPEHVTLINTLLQAACRGMAKTIRKQLVDFLPGGIYGQAPSDETVQRTSFAAKTNLPCEHHFGDLDSSQRRRPNCTFHHHSTVQMLKRNRRQIKEWLAKMTVEERSDIWKRARKHAKELREKHRNAEKEERDKLYKMAQRDDSKKKNKKIQIIVEEDELEEASRLEDKLKDLLPSQQTYEKDQWIAVAYQDNWYPGSESFTLPWFCPGLLCLFFGQGVFH